jgi:serine/threonine protein kinase
LRINQSQISFSELTILKELGEGSYGKVCLGKWNAAFVALKFCKQQGNFDEFLQEIRTMMYLIFLTHLFHI